MNTRMLAGMQDRVTREMHEGDVSYFQALVMKMEFIVKLVTAGVVACIQDDADRNRYGLEHRLVRANSLGEWIAVLQQCLVGPATQFFADSARPIVRELTERVPRSDWRYGAVSGFLAAAQDLELKASIGSKVALRQAFDLCVQIRNRTRGHGATTVDRCHQLCPPIAEALCALEENLQLFQLPWAYVRRNLSGKYLVIPLLGRSAPFDYLRSSSDTALADGVYVHLEESRSPSSGPSLRHRHIPLVFYIENPADIALPNGNFRDHDFEVLSYVTDDSRRVDGKPWLTPPTSLPPSETEGRSELDVVGNLLTNLPPKPIGHVPRHGLEARLASELRTTDRHPIVSLIGSGGDRQNYGGDCGHQ